MNRTSCSMVRSVAALLLISACTASASEIVRDAEFRILQAQNGERWARDDEAIDAKLAAQREKSGGKSPNIIYILLDDLGFGDIGMPDFAVTRGYKTPNLDTLARQGLSLQRMYTEPSCTPVETRRSERQPCLHVEVERCPGGGGLDDQPGRRATCSPGPGRTARQESARAGAW